MHRLYWELQQQMSTLESEIGKPTPHPPTTIFLYKTIKALLLQPPFPLFINLSDKMRNEAN